MTKVIAELGINHNGDFDTLISLADMAMGAGADYVKLQLRTPTVCVPQSEWDKPRLWFDGTMITYIDYRERMEFGTSQLALFDEYMEMQYGAGRWFASIWDAPSLDRLEKFSVPFVKIPSAMLTNESLLRHTVASDLPIIASLGMSTRAEVERAVEGLSSASGEVILMHCNSSYPALDSEIDLLTIRRLQEECLYNKKYDKFKIGFSSHSKSPYPAIYSMVLGAQYVEVHVTLDRTMQGTDHAASLEEAALKLICREAKKIPVLMGNGDIKLYESELPARKKLRSNM